jgi:DNA-binding transcriptional regulator YiaG
MTIKDICINYGLSQTALAKRFGIPLRTVQDWHSERRTPPDYVVNMMLEILAFDQKEQGYLKHIYKLNDEIVEACKE